MDNLDTEKLELIDKIKSLQNTIDDQNDDLQRKDKEMIALKKVINQMGKNEQNLLDELKTKNTHVKNLDYKMELMNKDNNKILEEYDNVTFNLKIEKENLFKSMNTMKNEIDCN